MNLLDELDKYAGFSHAFLTTYTFHPGFFEDRILHTKALRNCPNVIVFVDRHTYEDVCLDPKGGTLMNRRYMVVPVKAGEQQVFHAKVWLLAGQKRGRLFTGSANLTRSGIATNMEMVSIFDCEMGKSEECMPMLAAAFEFLESIQQRHCPRIVALKRIISEAPRSCPSIAATPGACHGVSLVHNLNSPILDARLPGLSKGKSAIKIVGPYYDASIGKLLDNLSTHFDLSEVEIIVQQETNTLDAAALQKWCQKHKAVKVKIAAVETPGRFLHAKGIVIYDVKGRPVLSLAGSANFTRPALLSATAVDGNVEAALLLEGDAAEFVSKALSEPPFSDRVEIDLRDLRTRPQSPLRRTGDESGLLRLESAEIAEDFTAIDVVWSGPVLSDAARRSMTLCVRRDDRSFMDFSCGPSRWVEEGHVQFRLLPKDTQYLAGAARAWLQLNDGNRQIQSNTVWLLHLDEVNESEKEQESRTLRQFRESGRGLTGYLQNLIDQGAIDRSIDLLDNLRIRYSNDMGRLRPHVLRPRRAISPIREDEEPLAMWRLTSDQRLQLGQAIQDFVERHHDKVLMKHVNNPNPNGLDNFLDVLETCTDLSIKSHQQGLLEGDVIRAMIRSGLGLFSGTVLKEGYSKALRGHMYGHDEELRRALGEYGTAERIATVAIATVCSSPAWKHGKACRAMTLSELVIACGCPQLTTFFEFTREPAADLPARVRACVSNYSEPGFFADIEVVTRAPMPAAPTIHGLEHGGYD